MCRAPKIQVSYVMNKRCIKDVAWRWIMKSFEQLRGNSESSCPTCLNLWWKIKGCSTKDSIKMSHYRLLNLLWNSWSHLFCPYSISAFTSDARQHIFDYILPNNWFKCKHVSWWSKLWNYNEYYPSVARESIIFPDILLCDRYLYTPSTMNQLYSFGLFLRSQHWHH